MRLSKVYSNYPRKFRPVTFRDGLNVIMGQVTQPSARDRDTHNLGKTLFAQVIDFCLMKKKNPDFFLFKHPQFEDFAFFLEISTQEGDFITVRRTVAEGSKGSFKHHKKPNQDFSGLPESEWDHWLLPFGAAKELLDGSLDLTALSPWSFRNAVSYSLRSQRDYDEPFKLAKFAGSHSEWKPFLAHILGFDGQVVSNGYEIEEELAKLTAEEKQLVARANGIEDEDQLRGQIRIVERESRAIQAEMEKFDFSPADERVTRALVSDLDSRLVDLNEERYSLTSDRTRINAALGVRLYIDVSALEKLFEEAQIYFGDQIRKDYAALESFNKELGEERDEYLREDLDEIEAQFSTIEAEITALNAERSSAIASLTDPQSISKYKRQTKQLVKHQADLESLRRIEGVLEALAAKKAEVRTATARLESVRSDLERSVKAPPEKYEAIRGYFDQIVYQVIGQHANLFSRVNKENHLEFEVDILGDGARPSSAGEGFSYGRLLCIAFDLAIMRAYLDQHFPHFVFHDGILETLDDRKKLNLLDVSREYAALGVQHIITVIESELPELADGARFAFEEDEVILRLSDRGQNGRLFRMPVW